MTGAVVSDFQIGSTNYVFAVAAVSNFHSNSRILHYVSQALVTRARDQFSHTDYRSNALDFTPPPLSLSTPPTRAHSRSLTHQH